MYNTRAADAPTLPLRPSAAAPSLPPAACRPPAAAPLSDAPAALLFSLSLFN